MCFQFSDKHLKVGIECLVEGEYLIVVLSIYAGPREGDLLFYDKK